MEIKKNKFLTGALLTVASLGVVGSITGTYAWYSYNTKAPITYSGIATGSSQNLQIQMYGDDAWSQSISEDEFVAYSTTPDETSGKCFAGHNLKPVSFAKTRKETDKLGISDFKGILSAGDPNYQDAGVYDETTKQYSFFRSQISLRCIDPTDNDSLCARKIYISDLTVQCTSKDEEEEIMDISDAIRVHISTKGQQENWLIAPGITRETGNTDTTGSLDLYGPLDLNGDDELDEGIYNVDPEDESETFDHACKYSWDEAGDDQVRKDIIYGTEEAVEKYYYADYAVSEFKKGKLETAGICLGTTSTSTKTTDTFDLTITIYLQGWADSVKDDFINAEFNFGMTLECEAI